MFLIKIFPVYWFHFEINVFNSFFAVCRPGKVPNGSCYYATFIGSAGIYHVLNFRICIYALCFLLDINVLYFYVV